MMQKTTTDASYPAAQFPMARYGSLTRANLGVIIKQTRTGDEPGRAEEIPEWLWKRRIRATLKPISAETYCRRHAIYPLNRAPGAYPNTCRRSSSNHALSLVFSKAALN